MITPSQSQTTTKEASQPVWHIFLVVCSGIQPSVTIVSNSCVAQTVSGTDFGGNSVTFNLVQSIIIGGSTLPLTSDSAIEAAAAAGIVTLIDTGVAFICPRSTHS